MSGNQIILNDYERIKKDYPSLGLIVTRIREVADPEKIIVFGSAGRGDNTSESDIDLLIIKSGNYDPISLAGDIYVHLHGIRQAVDIIVCSPDEFEKNKESFSSVLCPAYREGKVIYETELATG